MRTVLKALQWVGLGIAVAGVLNGNASGAVKPEAVAGTVAAAAEREPVASALGAAESLCRLAAPVGQNQWLQGQEQGLQAYIILHWQQTWRLGSAP